jgi:hypothetical protein
MSAECDGTIIVVQTQREGVILEDDRRIKNLCHIDVILRNLYEHKFKLYTFSLYGP